MFQTCAKIVIIRFRLIKIIDRLTNQFQTSTEEIIKKLISSFSFKVLFPDKGKIDSNKMNLIKAKKG